MINPPALRLPQHITLRYNAAMSDEPLPPQKKPLTPGKGYGIIALLCGLEPVLFLADWFCNSVLLHFFGLRIPYVISGSLQRLLIPCILGCIVFGRLAWKTEGWHYARTGLGLTLLFCLFMLFIGVMLIISLSSMMS
jgi:hypothetical protein